MDVGASTRGADRDRGLLPQREPRPRPDGGSAEGPGFFSIVSGRRSSETRVHPLKIVAGTDDHRVAP